jgi:queuine/archaeosine tRNA-ribosyltransferase
MQNSDENRPMTKEYAKLSYRVGILSGAVDFFLEESTFKKFTKFNQWNFTPTMVVEMQSVAMSLGFPEDSVIELDELCRQMQGVLMLILE